MTSSFFSITKCSVDRESITKCERVGVKKSADAKRPMKVTLKDAESVRKVLSKAKSEISEVFSDGWLKFRIL